MADPTLISDLQALLGNQDLQDLDGLIELASKRPDEDKQFALELLEHHLYEVVIPNQEEASFEALIPKLSLLRGIEANIPIAKLYYQFGLVSHKNHYFTKALSYLKQLREHDPDHFTSYMLWGDLLISFGQQSEDDVSIEEGLDFYAKALAKEGESGELYWNWALGWRALYDLSHERSDLKQAIDLCKRAEKLGVASPYFLLSYGLCYERQALATGDPSTLHKAMRLFRRAGEDPQVEQPVWEALARSQYHLALLTDSMKEFERAEKLFEEAISACPSLAELWLYWGKLLLRIGWRRGKVTLVEGAVEKLTSLKTSEINPVKVTSALAEALMALGVMIDDGKLVHEGAERVAKVLELYPQDVSLLSARAFSCLAKGLYFSDPKFLSLAANHFTELSQDMVGDVDVLFGQFEAYLHWGEQTKNLALLQKAQKAIERLVELRPFSPLLLTAASEALLLQYNTDKGMKNPGRLIEEAIAHLKRALSIREEFEAQFQLARAWDALGDVTGEPNCYEKAVSGLEQLYSKLPTDVRVVAYLAIALMHLGERTSNAEFVFRAVTLFEKALKHDSENGILLERVGYCKLLLSTMATDPNHPEEGDRWRSAAESYLKRSALFGCHDAYYHLACLYSQTAHFDYAMDSLRKAEFYQTLPSIETLEHSSWLEELRETQVFQTWLKGVAGG